MIPESEIAIIKAHSPVNSFLASFEELRMASEARALEKAADCYDERGNKIVDCIGAEELLKNYNPRTHPTLPEGYKVTWAKLVKLEPRLTGLLGMAMTPSFSQHGKKVFCANHFWGTSIKPLLVELVGWHVSTEILGTSEAYDVAYEKIYNALPNCCNCICL